MLLFIFKGGCHVWADAEDMEHRAVRSPSLGHNRCDSCEGFGTGFIQMQIQESYGWSFSEFGCQSKAAGITDNVGP